MRNSSGCTNWYAGTWKRGSSPKISRRTIQDVAAPITTEPTTRACRSARISSRVNRTAASGVLKAAATAAAVPTGISDRTCSSLRPRRRPATRCNSGADMDRRAFATKSNTAAQGDGRADELANHGSKADDAVLQNQGHARLRDSAPSGIREEPEQQPTAHQRAEQRTEESLHASRSQQNPAHALGDRHERNDNQTHHWR